VAQAAQTTPPKGKPVEITTASFAETAAYRDLEESVPPNYSVKRVPGTLAADDHASGRDA